MQPPSSNNFNNNKKKALTSTATLYINKGVCTWPSIGIYLAQSWCAKLVL